MNTIKPTHTKWSSTHKNITHHIFFINMLLGFWREHHFNNPAYSTTIPNICLPKQNQKSNKQNRSSHEIRKENKKIKQIFLHSYTNMVRDNHCRRSLKLIYQQRNPKIYKPCSEHPFIPKGLTNFANANITHLSFKSNHVPEFFMKNSNIRY